jgi:hypothetical protein
MIRTFLTKFQYRARFFSFPFKFEGLAIDETLMKTRYLPMNQRCRGTMFKIFDADVSEGFRFAFHNFLAALETRDLKFLKRVSEPTLYTELEKSMGLLHHRGLHVKHDSTDVSDLVLKYTAFSFVFGVHQERQKKSQ